MTAQQMRAALTAANIINEEKDTALGVMLASAQHYLTTKAKATVAGSKSALENVATGYTYQRALDKGLLK